jgi:dTDP-4-amino-4,6-dideoxy-D-galactose acyltransferase
MIEHLSWDSQFFGLKVGRAVFSRLSEEELASICKEKQEGLYAAVYLFSGLPADASHEKLEQAGCKLYDIKRTYYKDKLNNLAMPEGCLSYTGPLTPELLALAIDSGHKSRFRNDSRLQHKASELYTLWIEKSLSRQIADEVIVCLEAGKIQGFVSLAVKNGTGKIGLIAVDANCRGRGLGRKLMQAAESYYASAGAANAEVVTQQDNTGACRLYESSGYLRHTDVFVYHV